MESILALATEHFVTETVMLASESMSAKADWEVVSVDVAEMLVVELIVAFAGMASLAVVEMLQLDDKDALDTFKVTTAEADVVVCEFIFTEEVELYLAATTALALESMLADATIVVVVDEVTLEPEETLAADLMINPAEAARLELRLASDASAVATYLASIDLTAEVLRSTESTSTVCTDSADAEHDADNDA